MLTAILGITVIIESFVDFELKFLSKQLFGTQDQLTSFFGSLFAYLGTLSILFQILLTGRVLKRLVWRFHSVHASQLCHGIAGPWRSFPLSGLSDF
jgi:ATP/ADP translocase